MDVVLETPFRSNQGGRSDPAPAMSDPPISRQGIYTAVGNSFFLFFLKPKMSEGNKEFILQDRGRIWTRLYVFSP